MGKTTSKENASSKDKPTVVAAAKPPPPGDKATVKDLKEYIEKLQKYKEFLTQTRNNIDAYQKMDEDTKKNMLEKEKTCSSLETLSLCNPTQTNLRCGEHAVDAVVCALLNKRLSHKEMMDIIEEEVKKRPDMKIDDYCKKDRENQFSIEAIDAALGRYPKLAVGFYGKGAIKKGKDSQWGYAQKGKQIDKESKKIVWPDEYKEKFEEAIQEVKNQKFQALIVHLGSFVKLNNLDDVRMDGRHWIALIQDEGKWFNLDSFNEEGPVETCKDKEGKAMNYKAKVVGEDSSFEDGSFEALTEFLMEDDKLSFIPIKVKGENRSALSL